LTYKIPFHILNPRKATFYQLNFFPEEDVMLTRRFVGIAIAVIFVIAIGAPGIARSEDTKLTIMVFQGLQNLPLLAAQSMGFFAKRGLSVDIKIAPSSNELRDGLAEGRYQIVHTAVDNALAMSDVAKKDIAVIIGGDNGFNHLYVQPDINTYADLRQKTVFVDAPDTAYALQLYEMMRLNGLNKGDYTVKPVGATFKRLDSMLTSKDGKAAILNPPFSIRAEKSGLKDMGSAVKAIGPYQATAGFVMREWGKAHADTLVKYLQAYVEGLRWGLNPDNKAEAIKLYVGALKVPQDVAEATYAKAVDPVEGLAKDAKFDMEGFKNVLKLRAAFADNTPNVPEKYLDLSYYRKAVAGL
jgi:ABC-type nitrate/sulfonate/bicarbonate transport system substrate-binding protein